MCELAKMFGGNGFRIMGF